MYVNVDECAVRRLFVHHGQRFFILARSAGAAKKPWGWSLYDRIGGVSIQNGDRYRDAHDAITGAISALAPGADIQAMVEAIEAATLADLQG